jgi:hypothetical protein
VTLKAALGSGIALNSGFSRAVRNIGRRTFEEPSYDRESYLRAEAGVDTRGVTMKGNVITWEIAAEKPDQDILFEISSENVRSAKQLEH